MAPQILASSHARLQGDCLSCPQADSTALSLGLGWPFDLLGPTDVEEVVWLHAQSSAPPTLWSSFHPLRC